MNLELASQEQISALLHSVRDYRNTGGACMANVIEQRNLAVLGAVITDLTDQLIILLNGELAEERSAAVQRAAWSLERAKCYLRAQGGKPGYVGVEQLVDEVGKWRQR